MAFQGEVLPIGAVLRRAQTAPDQDWETGGAVVRHTAADNASNCAVMLASGATAEACWRFGILQTLDDYTSTRRRGGVAVAASVFTDPPPLTGSTALDAAFAALADYLAERDGWATPEWAHAATRRVDAWYPSVPAIFRREAEQDSPTAFRSRGIFITSRSLNRA